MRVAASAVVLLGMMLGPSCVVYDTPATHPVPRPVPAPGPSSSVEIRFFYDALDPYGDWIRFEPYGWVWAPAADPFWRPYTVGRWVWTDWGWTWVSGERWGWATYHYGRWARVKHHGWVWIPGDVWGPGWVAWRRGTGVVGWAPLPPEVRYRSGAGLDWGGTDIDVAIHVDAWCFLDESRLADADVHRHAYPVGRNGPLVRGTKNVTKVRVADKRIINEGIDRAEIERAAHRPVQTRRVVDQPRPQLKPAAIDGDQVQVYRPEVRDPREEHDPPRGLAHPPKAPSPDDVWKDDATQRAWDQRWNQDWRKLQKEQQRDLPAKTAGDKTAAAPPEIGRRHREENRQAAENAYDELVAAQERAKRKAERVKGGEPKPKTKDNGKPDDKKP